MWREFERQCVYKKTSTAGRTLTAVRVQIAPYKKIQKQLLIQCWKTLKKKLVFVFSYGQVKVAHVFPRESDSMRGCNNASVYQSSHHNKKGARVEIRQPWISPKSFTSPKPLHWKKCLIKKKPLNDFVLIFRHITTIN